MSEEKDYIKDIADIRTMMERSSRFLSLSGWAGILAGIYALAGSYIAYAFLGFNPTGFGYIPITSTDLSNLIILASAILLLSVGTATFLSLRKANKISEKVWNATSKRMLASMIVPLITGGILCLFCISNYMFELLAPLTLIFYGLALFAAGNFTFQEVRFLGLINIALGLIACFFIEYSMLLWATGFGIMHIVYGIYIYIKHEQ
jgi:hypothetical protein